MTVVLVGFRQVLPVAPNLEYPARSLTVTSVSRVTPLPLPLKLL